MIFFPRQEVISLSTRASTSVDVVVLPLVRPESLFAANCIAKQGSLNFQHDRTAAFSVGYMKL
jgi:hypothetical protein